MLSHLPQEITRFLRNPGKPAVLAMSRPDPKKNITTLVSGCGAGGAGLEVSDCLASFLQLADAPGWRRHCVAAPTDCSRFHNVIHGAFVAPSLPRDFRLALCPLSQVDAFGRHAMLRELANLVLVMVGGWGKDGWVAGDLQMCWPEQGGRGCLRAQATCPQFEIAALFAQSEPCKMCHPLPLFCLPPPGQP